MYSRLGVLLLIMTTSCAATSSKSDSPWRIELVTAGGFGGRGIGSFAIDSNGSVTVVTMTGKKCQFKASDDDLRRFEALLAGARPAEWSRYVPENTCCDRVEYTLTLDQAEKVYKAEWIDDPLPMPEDLVRVSSAIAGGEANSIRMAYGSRCK